MPDDRFPNKIQLLPLLGTPFSVTPGAWRYAVMTLVVGWGVAFVLNRGSGISSVFILGTVYGVLILLAYLLHTVGHIISAREVDAPMQENVFTATGQVNIYPPERVSKEVNMGRAVGGPLMNLTLAVVVFVVWAFIPGWGVLVFAGANLVYGAGALLPVPGWDGAVLWRGGQA